MDGLAGMFGEWSDNRTGVFGLEMELAYITKEAAINDSLSVTKLPGLLLRLHHHTSIKRMVCQTIL